jgi:putative membrane protein
MGPIGWLLQWPVRALVLLMVTGLPLGVEMANFRTALWSAVVIGLLGTLLIFPLKVVLGLPWAVASLGGLIAPVSWLFNWVITTVLFWLAAQLINGFTLKNGISSALLGAVAYGVISALLINALGLADVDFTRAAVS